MDSSESDKGIIFKTHESVSEASTVSPEPELEDEFMYGDEDEGLRFRMGSTTQVCIHVHVHTCTCTMYIHDQFMCTITYNNSYTKIDIHSTCMYMYVMLCCTYNYNVTLMYNVHTCIYACTCM